MKARDIGALALKNVLRARWKTVLCALAVCVGAASAYLVGEISANARQTIVDEMEKSGLGGMMIFSEGAEKEELRVQQILELPRQNPKIKAAMPVFMDYGSYQLKGKRGSAAIWGIDQQFSDIFPVEVKYGRLPGAGEVRQGARVAVVEDALAQKVYHRENIIGKEITIYRDSIGESYEIIGVIRSQKRGLEGLMGGGKLPVFLYTPYTADIRYSSQQPAERLAISCQDGEDLEAVTAAAVRSLSRQNQGGKFSSENISGYLDSFSAILSAVSLMIAAIGGVSLIVGGVGVMNSMVSAIENRKKEIGIYLAVGARPRDIVLCYLLEAVIICLLGGLAGGAVGAGLLWVGGKLLGATIVFHLRYLLLAQLAAGGCGLLFGALPARRAARLSPIDAIRCE